MGPESPLASEVLEVQQIPSEIGKARQIRQIFAVATHRGQTRPGTDEDFITDREIDLNRLNSRRENLPTASYLTSSKRKNLELSYLCADISANTVYC